MFRFVIDIYRMDQGVKLSELEYRQLRGILLNMNLADTLKDIALANIRDYEMFDNYNVKIEES
jgi:hypothetical protein